METDIHLHHTQTAQYTKVEAILTQMATVLRDLKTYEPGSSEIRGSLRACLAQLTPFLKRNDSLTLLVDENALVYGERVVYSCEERLDSLAFALYRDGIRLITFTSGVTGVEIETFMRAVHEARGADPGEADLVTMLWEKDLANITYHAVDSYLDTAAPVQVELVDQAGKKPERDESDTSEGGHPQRRD